MREGRKAAKEIESLGKHAGHQMTPWGQVTVSRDGKPRQTPIASDGALREGRNSAKEMASLGNTYDTK